MHTYIEPYNTHIYRVSVKKGRSHSGSMEEVKENKKVLYHFANFASFS